jgi:hypothetical protein
LYLEGKGIYPVTVDDIGGDIVAIRQRPDDFPASVFGIPQQLLE